MIRWYEGTRKLERKAGRRERGTMRAIEAIEAVVDRGNFCVTLSVPL